MMLLFTIASGFKKTSLVTPVRYVPQHHYLVNFGGTFANVYVSVTVYFCPFCCPPSSRHCYLANFDPAFVLVYVCVCPCVFFHYPSPSRLHYLADFGRASVRISVCGVCLQVHTRVCVCVGVCVCLSLVTAAPLSR